MDMSQAFVRAAKEMIPFAESKIVHDKFHIMKIANEAVDKVRRGEHKRLLKDGDDRLRGE
jgi:transposase